MGINGNEEPDCYLHRLVGTFWIFIGLGIINNKLKSLMPIRWENIYHISEKKLGFGLK